MKNPIEGALGGLPVLESWPLLNNSCLIYVKDVFFWLQQAAKRVSPNPQNSLLRELRNPGFKVKITYQIKGCQETLPFAKGGGFLFSSE